ncbi:MAG TPA: UDP-N-acetylmuramoyl-tripeptide--D-alanyl-D-alanine ligase [Solirubrobacteraceae bacterium]|nr:UDP-N-acetylmuramoyl-tripeptide--D-alanyl-D-alanine ligase [Solirubrobacteraceae bacterium]
MRAWSPQRVAEEAGGRLASVPRSDDGPDRVIIDSRRAGPGALFVGLAGSNHDGGRFAASALEAGAWGVMVADEHVGAARDLGRGGAVIAAGDPLLALQRLATAWRRELAAEVIGVTGSTGKTSTKDLLLSLLAPHRRTVASRSNFNTEIGLPLEILAAPVGTEVLVLEMAMRGVGQIAELAAIAEPTVGVIVSIGPVHLELLGTIEAIAAAKAELIAALPPGATAVIPAAEPLLAPHLRPDIETITFGAGGQVRLLESDGDRVRIDRSGTRIELEVSFPQAHLRRNLLAAVAAVGAVGVVPSGRVELPLSAGRGARVRTGMGVTLIDDCYNANPMSMRAALDDLALAAETAPRSRRVAVLGDMLELGKDELDFHAEIGEHAARAGVELLVTVGPRAAAMSKRFAGRVRSLADANEAAEIVPSLLRDGDLVLVKGSRAVGLERVCRALRDAHPVGSRA